MKYYIYSECCDAQQNKNIMHICPVCHAECKWIEVDEDGNPIQDKPTNNQINNNHCTEGGISFNQPAWNGR